MLVSSMKNNCLDFLFTATSYETRREGYIWWEAWQTFTDNGRLFSGSTFFTISLLLVLKLRFSYNSRSNSQGSNSSCIKRRTNVQALFFLMFYSFQAIKGIPAIPIGYNPATWMLEVTTPAIEQSLEVDFAELYRESSQFR